MELHANIELPDDVHQAKENAAAGIGLFRSEFLFLNRDVLPSEDEQFEAYRKVAVEMKQLPVTIRTLDLGADKNLNDAEARRAEPRSGVARYPAVPGRTSDVPPSAARDPAGIALRQDPPAHSDAVHRARVAADPCIWCSEAKNSLDADGYRLRPGIPVGGMIEIPAAALSLGTFTRKLDFLSIGTNDLIQYTLAIDRTDDAVAHLYDPLHPAVLLLVAHIIRGSQQSGRSGRGVRGDGRGRAIDSRTAGVRTASVLHASRSPAHRQATGAQIRSGRGYPAG